MVLWQFGRFYGYLVDFSRLGMLYQEKSGNPVPRYINGEKIAFADRSTSRWCAQVLRHSKLNSILVVQCQNGLLKLNGLRLLANSLFGIFLPLMIYIALKIFCFHFIFLD
jgi:hypothetical protein